MKNKLTGLIFFILLLSMVSCQDKGNGKLPYIGQTKIMDGDTIHHKIPPFDFVNQDSLSVTNASLENHIYVADFFFTSCPSICPKVKKNMLRIYDRFEDTEQLKLVSHTLDPVRDDVKVLHQYSSNLGVEIDRWIFLTGDKDELLDMADDYFVTAYEDPDAPGGFDHSGKILLIDKDGHVRAFAEGTDADDVTEFMDEIDILLKEYALE